MKVFKTLLVGFGILLGCGCGRVVRTDFAHTTYGTYAGSNPTAYRNVAGSNYRTAPTQSHWSQPGQRYNMPTYR